MSTTPLLGITELTPNQTGKEATINTAIAALEAATNGTLAVDMSAGDVTLSVSQFTSAYIFDTNGLTAARTLNIPAQINGQNVQRVFCVSNPSAYQVTVGVAGGAGSTVNVPAGENRLVSVDGSGNVNVVGMPPSATNFIHDTTTNHNISATDSSAIIMMDNAAANSVTIQPDSTINLAVGTRVYVMQVGAGVTSFAGGVGVTLDTSAGLALRNQWSIGYLTKTAANTWVLAGDLSDMGVSVALLAQFLSNDGGLTLTADLVDNLLKVRNSRFMIPFWFELAPEPDEVLGRYIATDSFQIHTNFAGSTGTVATAPTADFTITVSRQVNATGSFLTIGTLVIHTDGSITWSTTGGTPVDVGINDVIKFTAQTTTDAAILGGAFNIRGY